MALIPVSTAGPYWVGDIPTPIDIVIEDVDGDVLEIDDSTTVDADLRMIGIHGTTTLVATVMSGGGDDADYIRVTFPGTSPLTVQGVYDVEMKLHTGSNVETVEPFSLVVQDYDGWLTLTQARRGWSDAPDDDVLLYGLLDAAKRACIQFAPALPLDDDADVILPLPAGYTQAQLLQARNTWNSVKTDPSIAGDDQMFVIRPYPLDNFIKQLLRPRTGIPAVG